MALLTVEQLRAFVTSALGDDELQLLLDGAEAAIVARYGPAGADVTEIYDGGQTYIFLRRQASAIVEVKEDVEVENTTITTTDYRLRPDGVSLRRLETGPNFRHGWGQPVSVKYTPIDDTAERKRIQVALVELELNHDPGSTMETIGSWTEQSQSSSVWNYEAERESILASLAASLNQAPGFA